MEIDDFFFFRVRTKKFERMFQGFDGTLRLMESQGTGA